MKIINCETSRNAIDEYFTLTVEFRGDGFNPFDCRQLGLVGDVYRHHFDCGIDVRPSVHTSYNAASTSLKVEKVIFNNPATIVFWNDGSKTVVKCGEGETFDEEKGFAIACTKKMFGNNHIYYGKMQKAIEKAVRKETDNDNSKE